jgi:hypothetical protein
MARSIQSFRYASGHGNGPTCLSPNVSFSAIQSVQGAALAVLISVLWLVASVHAVIDAAGPGFVGLDRSSKSGVEHSRDGSLEHAFYVNPAAQRINRRLASQPSNDDSSPPLIAKPPALRSADRPSTLLWSSVAPPGLVECWQFLWRTASDARAPSRIS